MKLDNKALIYIYKVFVKYRLERIEVRITGSRDDGGCDSVDFYPNLEIDYETISKLEEIGLDLLEEEHPGWEVNEGSRNLITFSKEENPLEIRIEIDHEYYVAQNLSDYEIFEVDKNMVDVLELAEIYVNQSEAETD